MSAQISKKARISVLTSIIQYIMEIIVSARKVRKRKAYIQIQLLKLFLSCFVFVVKNLVTNVNFIFNICDKVTMN